MHLTPILVRWLVPSALAATAALATTSALAADPAPAPAPPTAPNPPAAPNPPSAEPTPPKLTQLVAEIGPLRNQAGSVGCRLYTSGPGFPEAAKGTVEQRVTIGGTHAKCTFDRLPPGKYAVTVMHDENDNQKLDKNFVGMPVEGYGVSNNKTYALHGPRWEESAFVLDGEPATVKIAISLRY